MSEWTLEGNRRCLVGQRPDRVHELFEDAATTAVTECRNFVIEHLGVAHWILADRAREQVLATGSSLEFVCRGLGCAGAPTWTRRQLVLRSRPVWRAISLIDLPLTQAPWTSM